MKKKVRLSFTTSDVALDSKKELLEVFKEVLKVVEFGEKKHPRIKGEGPNWLQPDGNKSSFKDMHDSAFHHLAKSYAAGLVSPLTPYYRADDESDLDHLAHGICRQMMMLRRIKLGIEHDED